jgi:hypothetical protein
MAYAAGIALFDESTAKFHSTVIQEFQIFFNGFSFICDHFPALPAFWRSLCCKLPFLNSKPARINLL